MAEPSVSDGLPSREEILQRLRTRERPSRPVDGYAVVAIDVGHLRADLEALAGSLAGIRALIRPPNDLPPALHRIRLLRFGPIRGLLLRAFEILFRRQMLINEQFLTALEVERSLIYRIGQALGDR